MGHKHTPDHLDFQHMKVKASGILLYKTFRCRCGEKYTTEEKVKGADRNRRSRRQNMDWDED